MTDADLMLTWLRDAMDAAQRDAEAAGGYELMQRLNWSWDELQATSIYLRRYCLDFLTPIADHQQVKNDVDSPTEEQQAHIVRNSPAAVLRRIAADRKLLDLHTDVAGKCVECTQATNPATGGPTSPVRRCA